MLILGNKSQNCKKRKKFVVNSRDFEKKRKNFVVTTKIAR